MKALSLDITDARPLFKGIHTMQITGERCLTLPAPVFRIHDDETKEILISTVFHFVEVYMHTFLVHRVSMEILSTTTLVLTVPN